MEVLARGWRAGAALTVAAGAAHAGPALARARPLRVPVLPTLAGVGRADHVAVTFDDGPDPTSTPAFLSALDVLGVRATFFLLGRMAVRAPELVQEIVAVGHEVGAHGWSHRNHLFRSPVAVVEDLRRVHGVLGDITGTAPCWFRPPYGVLTAGTLAATRRLGLRPVLWTAWGRDWEHATTPSGVVRHVGATLAPGATVLLHDSGCTAADPSAWRRTLAALPALVDLFARAGLEPGRLAEHGIGPVGSGRR